MPEFHALIIDDNPTDADVLRALLARLGLTYDVVIDSRKLPDVLPDLTVPDFIFLDLEMPGINGYQVLDALRAAPDYANVPVIAYTAHSAEMPYAREAGFHSFLGKPLRGASFQDQLERIINNIPVWEVR